MMDLVPHDRTVNLLVHAALWGAFLVWQLSAVLRPEVPGVIVLVRQLRRWRVARWLLVFGWGWLGWHLFVRTHIGG